MSLLTQLTVPITEDLRTFSSLASSRQVPCPLKSVKILYCIRVTETLLSKSCSYLLMHRLATRNFCKFDVNQLQTLKQPHQISLLGDDTPWNNFEIFIFFFLCQWMQEFQGFAKLCQIDVNPRCVHDDNVRPCKNVYIHFRQFVVGFFAS